MKRILYAMILVTAVWGLNPFAADARVLTLSADPMAVLPADQSGDTKLAASFNVGSLDQEGVRVQRAFLEWTVDGVDPKYAPEFTVHNVTATWNATAVAAGQAGVSIEESYRDSWAIEELDYERNGGFVRLDVTDLVRGWLSGAITNRGLLVGVSGVNRTTVTSEASDLRLVIRYGYWSN